MLVVGCGDSHVCMCEERLEQQVCRTARPWVWQDNRSGARLESVEHKLHRRWCDFGIPVPAGMNLQVSSQAAFGIPGSSDEDLLFTHSAYPSTLLPGPAFCLRTLYVLSYLLKRLPLFP